MIRAVSTMIAGAILSSCARSENIENRYSSSSQAENNADMPLAIDNEAAFDSDCAEMECTDLNSNN